MKKNDFLRNLLFWGMIAIGLMFVFGNMNQDSTRSKTIDYSAFVQQLQSGQIRTVDVDGREFQGQTASRQTYITYAPI